MCAAANYSRSKVSDGYATLRRVKRRISQSILTIPEYLSEFQLFQMKNISVKSRNGIKEAQQNVPGRDGKKKPIMNTGTERPPKLPGRDYKHVTPEDDGSGWDSDEFDSEDEEHPGQDYMEPMPDEVYPNGTCKSYSEDESYIQQQAPAIPARRRSPPPVPKDTRPAHSPRPRDLPRTPKADSGPPPLPPGRKPIPQEPQGGVEVYEEPDSDLTRQGRPVSDPELYEEPEQFSPTPPSIVARNHGNVRNVSPMPARVPRHQEPEELYELDESDSPEDYELPDPATLKPPSLPSHPNQNNKRTTGGINVMPSTPMDIRTSGPIKPSDLRPKKTNSTLPYTPPKFSTNVNKATSSWADHDSPVKPSDLKKKQYNNTTPIKAVLPGRNVNKQLDDRGSASVSNTPVSIGRSLPKTPSDDEGLYSYTWYHSDMSRELATDKLLARRQNGMFLVRKSSKAGSPYALSLFYGGRVYNLNVRLRPDNKFALGIEKADEKVFHQVSELIGYFQSNALVLGGDTSTQTTLKLSLPK